MADLPKIVRQRLEQASRVGDPGRPGAASAHPDVNELAAFAERTASSELRQTMLVHFSECAACRDLLRTLSRLEPQGAVGRAVLVAPTLAADPSQSSARAEPQGEPQAGSSAPIPAVVPTRELLPAATPGQGSFAWWDRLGWWTALRIAAAAAALILVAAALWLRNTGHKRMDAGPEVAMAPSPAPAQPALPDASNEVSHAKKDTLPAVTEPASKRRSPDVVPSPPSRKVMGKSVAGARPASPGDLAQNHMTVSGGVASQGRESQEPKGLLQSLPAEMSASDKAAAHTSRFGAAADLPRPHAEESKAAAVQAPTIQEGIQERNQASPSAQASGPAAKNTDGFAAIAGLHRAALMPPGDRTKWRIAVQPREGQPMGRLQRSTDGGRTWQLLPVDDSISLSVVAGDGSNLWVGGAAGALYHSRNAGSGWQRVTVAASDGRPLSGSIVSITVVDSQRVLVTTTSHEVWSTDDGAVTWKLTSD